MLLWLCIPDKTCDSGSELSENPPEKGLDNKDGNAGDGASNDMSVDEADNDDDELEDIEAAISVRIIMILQISIYYIRFPIFS